MSATSQWVFLCAAHRTPRECPALDYTLHTLHGASSLLNSNKHFPSRVSIKENSVQKLSSIARRVYRIFSHAYFHHRELFDDFEESTYLCHRFTRYVIKYELMTLNNLIVPIGDAAPSETEDASSEDNLSSSDWVDSPVTSFLFYWASFEKNYICLLTSFSVVIRLSLASEDNSYSKLHTCTCSKYEYIINEPTAQVCPWDW